MEKAAGFYQAAAESQSSAMAYFNLGYMYEHGLGVPQVRLDAQKLHPSMC